ncbi:MAG: histidinol-phosphate transaminase [Solibacillus sp.]
MLLPSHGANASALYKATGITMPQEVIDVSENVNVDGFPEKIKEHWPSLLTKLATYPNEQAEPFYTDIADFHEVQKSHVVVTNGAAEGLVALAQFFRGKDIALLEPSFSEYKRTLQQQNCTIHSIISNDISHYRFNEQVLNELLLRVSAIYICNPNNPTGVLLKKEWIEDLIQKYPHCDFVIDEAFIDWTDEGESVVALTNTYTNLFVLRSMTKMFGLAGVRLGYVIGKQADKLRCFLPHWNVSNIAIELGSICLQEQQFVKKSREKSGRLREEMSVVLKNLGCTISDSSANFFLFKLPNRLNPDAFFSHLLNRGIVLRHTKNYVGLDGEWFRIAVKSEEIWAKCKEEIINYVENH